MPKFAALPLGLAAILVLTAAAQAGGHRSRLPVQPPSSVSAGTVNNYYGPVTIYQGGAAPSASYDTATAYPTYDGSYAYGGGYSSSGLYYGADYGASWGQPFAGGVGYSPYGNYGGYGTGATPVYGARMDPWNGYNGAPGNGYW